MRKISLRLLGLVLACGLPAAVVLGCDGEQEGDGDDDTGTEVTDTASPPEDSVGGGDDVEPSPDSQTPEDTADEQEDVSEDTTIDCSARNLPSLTATPVAGGHRFRQPLYVTQPPGESETLFVVERPGRIVRVKNGQVQSPPFLDIRSKVSTNHGERGLLGLAFHPNYQQNGRFFVFYTPKTGGAAGANVVAEFERKSKDPDVANNTEVRRLVDVADDEGNHNGGMIAFGPNGYLFAGMGDGGSGCDTGGQHAADGNGQTTTNLFGSLLRLDVDAPGRDYAPKDNPFVGESGEDQIWAYGLRNPWRFSFDRKRGDLYIGDVGQSSREEIDLLPAGTSGGQNFGWRAYEGTLPCSDGEHSCTRDCNGLDSRVDNHTPPILEYEYGSVEGEAPRGGKSVTGGYVYRGDAIPKLEGYYLYGDYKSKDISAFRYCGGSVVDHRRLSGLKGLGSGLASFGEDTAGELYLVYISSGDVLRLQRDE